MITAYFKYRALKQMQINHAPAPQEPIRAEVKVEVRPIPPEQPVQQQPQYQPGLNLVGFCPTSQQNILSPQGFGRFNLIERWARQVCTCCDKKFLEIIFPERNVVFKDCVFSYAAMDAEQNERDVRNMIAGEPLKLSFQNPTPFKWLDLNVNPLP